MRAALVEHASAMQRLAGSLCLASLVCLASACDSGAKKDEGTKAAAKGDAKKDEAKK